MDVSSMISFCVQSCSMILYSTVMAFTHEAKYFLAISVFAIWPREKRITLYHDVSPNLNIIFKLRENLIVWRGYGQLLPMFSLRHVPVGILLAPSQKIENDSFQAVYCREYKVIKNLTVGKQSLREEA